MKIKNKPGCNCCGPAAPDPDPPRNPACPGCATPEHYPLHFLIVIEGVLSDTCTNCELTGEFIGMNGSYLVGLEPSLDPAASGCSRVLGTDFSLTCAESSFPVPPPFKQQLIWMEIDDDGVDSILRVKIRYNNDNNLITWEASFIGLGSIDCPNILSESLPYLTQVAPGDECNATASTATITALS